jgi:predicted amidohydrolase YtcJ
VPQAIFLPELGRNFRAYLPDALLPRCYPIRAMLDAGLTVALSSDAPVVENDNPLAGMTAAITRRDGDGQPLLPDQAITAAEALDAYTRGGAVAVGLAGELGTIAPGFRADLAVLSGDPLTTPADALADLTVDVTLLGGHLVYERP